MDRMDLGSDYASQTIDDDQSFLYQNLTREIIGTSYTVMNELGVGFLESVYHKALDIALRQNGFNVQFEAPLKVFFRGYDIGTFKADLIVDQKIIIEVKTTDKIIGEHKAQIINYLSASRLPVGLIINFGQAKVEIARLQCPISCSSCSS